MKVYPSLPSDSNDSNDIQELQRILQSLKSDLAVSERLKLKSFNLEDESGLRYHEAYILKETEAIKRVKLRIAELAELADT